MLVRARDEPLFDEGQIGLLRDAVGADDLLSMLLELPPAATDLLAAITDALTAGDIDQARRSSHVLKGCASTFGAARLAAIAGEIELDAPSLDAMRQLVPALAETLAVTAAALAVTAAADCSAGCST